VNREKKGREGEGGREGGRERQQEAKAAARGKKIEGRRRRRRHNNCESTGAKIAENNLWINFPAWLVEQ
jgi:hypothetical protein